MTNGPTTIAQRQQQLSVVWVALLAAVGTYTAVCFLIVNGAEPLSEQDAEWMRYVFSGIGVALGLFSAWWRRQFLSPVVPGTETEVSVLTRLQSHSIVVWTLSEAVAICGLLFAMVAHSFREFVPFALASVALLLLHRPSNLPLGQLSDTLR
jgi:F0F1-type ATP synthase membrane subunit c/vacuolar-type H+-ATPase subunit K